MKTLKLQVKKKYGNMPFNLRNFEEEARAKMGVVECVAHKLIEPFQVLYEKHSKLIWNLIQFMVCKDKFHNFWLKEE